MRIVFSDLDGTLLDHRTYGFDAARPALARLAEAGIPLILASSKTEAEMRPIAAALDLSTPLIVENGAGIAAPGGGRAHDDPLPGADAPGIERIRRALADLPADLRGCFSGLSGWSLAEIARRTGLDRNAARLAQQRRHSEPGVFTGNAEARRRFDAHLRRHALRTVEGGRFLTITPTRSKADALKELVRRYALSSGRPVTTLALGDGANDLAMLEAADRGVIVANPHHPPLPLTDAERAGRIIRTDGPGPAGWNAAVSAWIDETGGPCSRPTAPGRSDRKEA